MVVVLLITAWAFSLISWRLANSLRRLSRDLDQARERERARNFRDLHDRVLQTLEIMGREGWVYDDRARQHISREATWLRRRIEDGLDRPGELVEALRAVADQQAAVGLRVDLNTAGMDGAAPPAAVTMALVDAAREALTNVRKHAGVDCAVLRAAPAEAGVMVTVLDHGRGFDPAAVTAGLGLRESLGARLREAGGWTHIESAPGAGTYVELWVPN